MTFYLNFPDQFSMHTLESFISLSLNIKKDVNHRSPWKHCVQLVLLFRLHTYRHKDNPVEDIYNTIHELAKANFITVKILDFLSIYLIAHAVKKIIKLTLNDLQKTTFLFSLAFAMKKNK